MTKTYGDATASPVEETAGLKRAIFFSLEQSLTRC